MNIIIKKASKRCFIAPIVSILWSVSSLAYAAGTGNDMLSSVLESFIKLLTSTPARLIFVLSIIGIGYGTLALGRIPKEKAVAAIVGIGIVFSASYIAHKLGLSR